MALKAGSRCESSELTGLWSSLWIHSEGGEALAFVLVVMTVSPSVHSASFAVWWQTGRSALDFAKSQGAFKAVEVLERWQAEGGYEIANGAATGPPMSHCSRPNFSLCTHRHEGP